MLRAAGQDTRRHRVIVANSGPADRMPELVMLQSPGELAGCVIASAIRVEDRLLGKNMVPGGHVYGPLVSGVL